jgi:hypothetical protein
MDWYYLYDFNFGFESSKKIRQSFRLCFPKELTLIFFILKDIQMTKE